MTFRDFPNRRSCLLTMAEALLVWLSDLSGRSETSNVNAGRSVSGQDGEVMDAFTRLNSFYKVEEWRTFLSDLLRREAM